MNKTDWPPLIESTFIGISTGIMVAKFTLYRNNGVIIPCQFNTSSMSNISTISDITTIMHEESLLSLVLGCWSILCIQYREGFEKRQYKHYEQTEQKQVTVKEVRRWTKINRHG